MTLEHPDYVVLHPSGLAYGSRRPGEWIDTALGRDLPAGTDVSSMGHGRLRIWHADSFTDPALLVNPVADYVIGRLGYHHTSGWYGAVAISMEEDRHSGEIAPLLPELIATLAEMTAGMFRAEDGAHGDMDAAPDWGPAREYAPDLLHTGALMLMSAHVNADGTVIQRYKHRGTRRHLCLDRTGQAWRPVHGQTDMTPTDPAAAELYVNGLRDDYAEDPKAPAANVAAADPAVVASARNWLHICATEDGSWPALGGAAGVARLTPLQVVLAVAHHWGGGLSAFLSECADDIAERTTNPSEA